MATFRRNLWAGALVFGLIFIGMGIVFAVQAQNTRAMIVAAMQEEGVKTGPDGEKFGVPNGTPVIDAKSAQAQADTIKLHSISIKGDVLKSGQDTTLYYAGMTEALFKTPELRTAARNTYLNGLNLRNALSIAIMGFGVCDLVLGIGAMLILLGVGVLGIAVPALYWAREAEGEVVREVSRRLAPAMGTATAGH